MAWTGHFDGEGTAGVYQIARKDPGLAEGGSLQWHNTHLESLQAIHAFIGCGVICHRKLTKGGNKPMHALVVQRKYEILKVIPQMLPYSIIKRDALLRVMDACVYGVRPGIRGSVNALGAEEIKRMYEEELLSQRDIAARLGITDVPIKRFMKNHGIVRRSPTDPLYQQKRDARRWTDESRATASKTRSEAWKDPVYRAKATAAMRLGQPKRIAATKANREARLAAFLPLEID